MERHPGDSPADPLGDERLHARHLAACHLGAPHQSPAAVLDAALSSIGGVDFDEHVLLQLGEPLVGPRLLSAALELDEATGTQDDGELLGDALVDRDFLHRETNVWNAKLPGIGQRRVFGDEVGAWRVDRLPVHRDRIRQGPRICARLAVAERDAAVLQRHALDAAGQVDGP